MQILKITFREQKRPTILGEQGNIVPNWEGITDSQKNELVISCELMRVKSRLFFREL